MCVFLSARGGVAGRQGVQPGPHQAGHLQDLPLALHLPEGNAALLLSLPPPPSLSVHSTLPPHLQGGPYHDLLHSVLGAYTCYRPDIGYVSLRVLTLAANRAEWANSRAEGSQWVLKSDGGLEQHQQLNRVFWCVT